MRKYRIKEYQFYRNKSYVIQRRSIFGFWYNIDNVDSYTTGRYNTLEEATEMINQKLFKPIIKYHV